MSKQQYMHLALQRKHPPCQRHAANDAHKQPVLACISASTAELVQSCIPFEDSSDPEAAAGQEAAGTLSPRVAIGMLSLGDSDPSAECSSQERSCCTVPWT